jgi:hypothetical protein
MRRVRVTIVVVEKQLLLCIFIVFLALGIQHAMRMSRIASPTVACQVLQYIFALSQKRHDFRGKGFENKTRVFIPFLNFARNISQCTNKGARCDKRKCIGLYAIIFVMFVSFQ